MPRSCLCPGRCLSLVAFLERAAIHCICHREALVDHTTCTRGELQAEALTGRRHGQVEESHSTQPDIQAAQERHQEAEEVQILLEERGEKPARVSKATIEGHHDACLPCSGSSGTLEVCLYTPYHKISLTLPLLCRWTPSFSGTRFAEALHAVATICLPTITQCRCFLSHTREISINICQQLPVHAEIRKEAQHSQGGRRCFLDVVSRAAGVDIAAWR